MLIQLLGVECEFRKLLLGLDYFLVDLFVVGIHTLNAHFLLGELESPILVQIDVGFDFVIIPSELCPFDFFEGKVLPLEALLLFQHHLTSLYGILQLFEHVVLFVLSLNLVWDDFGNLKGEKSLADG